MIKLIFQLKFRFNSCKVALIVEIACLIAGLIQLVM